ncbi:MAG: 30S ribosomal protein S7 [Candidatus Aminicenantes bacterium]|nr:30S ribosomal protein S7 [Candidatus Aminicenantes bacterium]
MPRKGKVKKRNKTPDQFFNSTLISQLINGVMVDGKKSLAARIVYESLEKIRKTTKEDPLKTYEKAVNNIRPLLETKSRRVGGATYQVPVEVDEKRATSLAIRWLLAYSKQRPGKSFVDKLSGEIMDAADNKGGAIKKREDTHRMAKANRAFAHYKW